MGHYLGGIGADGSNVFGASNGRNGKEGSGEEFDLHGGSWWRVAFRFMG